MEEKMSKKWKRRRGNYDEVNGGVKAENDRKRRAEDKEKIF
jgi:hypothetical protein